MAEGKTGEEFKAEVEIQFANMQAILDQLASGMRDALASGFTPTKTLDAKMAKVLQYGNDLADVMDKASTEADFAKAQASMTFVANEAQKIANTLGNQKNLDVIDAGQIRQAAHEMGIYKRAVEASQHATIKTHLASQNVLRIVQDLPYGMFGVANNIEQLAESFGHLRAQGLTVGQSIKAAFMPLVSGPMAIPFVISLMTMFILSWDKLAKMIDGARVALGLMTDAQRDHRDAMRDFNKNAVEQLVEGVSDENVALFLAQTEERIEETEDKIRESANRVRELFSEEFVQKWTPGAMGAPAQPIPFNLTAEQERQKAEYDKAQEELNALNKLLKQQKDAFARLRDRDQLAFEKDKLGRQLGFTDLGENEKVEKERTKEARDFELELAQIRIDAMQEGLQKTLAQIALNARKESEALVKEFGPRADLMEALEEKNAMVRSQTISKFYEQYRAEQDKFFEEERKAEIERRKRLLEERKKSIQEASEISMFGIQSRLFQALAEIDRNDPYAAERAQMLSAVEADLNEIATKRATITEEVNAGLKDQALANAELEKLLDEEVLIRKEAADRIKEIEEEKRQVIMGVFGGMASDMESFFGDMNFLAQKEGANGFEETKKYLYAQAVMQALSAGIAAATSIMQMPGVPAPIKIASAIATGASITARFLAAAKRIKSIGRDGGGGGGVSGGFTAINTSVSGSRVAAFERQQQIDRASFVSAGNKEGFDMLGEKLDGLSSRIQNQRVTIDDRTSASVVKNGSYFNKRITGKSDAGV